MTEGKINLLARIACAFNRLSAMRMRCQRMADRVPSASPAEMVEIVERLPIYMAKADRLLQKVRELRYELYRREREEAVEAMAILKALDSFEDDTVFN